MEQEPQSPHPGFSPITSLQTDATGGSKLRVPRTRRKSGGHPCTGWAAGLFPKNPQRLCGILGGKKTETLPLLNFSVLASKAHCLGRFGGPGPRVLRAGAAGHFLVPGPGRGGSLSTVVGSQFCTRCVTTGGAARRKEASGNTDVRAGSGTGSQPDVSRLDQKGSMSVFLLGCALLLPKAQFPPKSRDKCCY